LKEIGDPVNLRYMNTRKAHITVWSFSETDILTQAGPDNKKFYKYKIKIKRSVVTAGVTVPHTTHYDHISLTIKSLCFPVKICNKSRVANLGFKWVNGVVVPDPHHQQPTDMTFKVDDVKVTKPMSRFEDYITTLCQAITQPCPLVYTVYAWNYEADPEYKTKYLAYCLRYADLKIAKCGVALSATSCGTTDAVATSCGDHWKTSGYKDLSRTQDLPYPEKIKTFMTIEPLAVGGVGVTDPIVTARSD